MGKPIKGTVVSVAPDAYSRPTVGDFHGMKSWGHAIEYVIEDDDGRMYACTEDEAASTQVNFCPFTGKEAKVKCNDN